MPRRPLIVLCAVVAVAAVALVLLARGGGSDRGVRDPLGAALAYAPASAQVVAELDVAPGSQQGQAVRDLAATFEPARYGASAIRSTLLSFGLDPDADVPPLLGGPLVVAGPSSALTAFARTLRDLQPDLTTLLRGGAIAAIAGRSPGKVRDALAQAARDRRLRALPGSQTYALAGGAGVLAARGAVVVLARDRAALGAAIALHDRGGGLTPATFAARLGPRARRPARLKLAAQARVLLAPVARGVPFADALRGGALALSLERPGLRLRVHLATDPARLRAEDLPLAPGPAPPTPAAGAAPASAAVRDLGQTLRVLDAARGALRIPAIGGLERALGTLDEVRGPLRTFAGIDVDAALLDQLTGTTTFTISPGGWAIRAELQDGGPLRTALRRIAAVPDQLIALSGLTELNVAPYGDEAFAITRGGRAVLHAAVLGRTLVLTSDLRAGLRAIADRRPRLVAHPGALGFHARGRAIQDLLIRRFGLPDLARLVLSGFGDLDGWASASRSAVDLDATLALDQ